MNSEKTVAQFKDNFTHDVYLNKCYCLVNIFWEEFDITDSS